MDDKQECCRQERFKNRIEAFDKKKKWELEHGLRPQNNKIGNYYLYDHKITSVFGICFISLSVIMQSSVMSYLYIAGLAFILKDTVRSGFTPNKFKLSKMKLTPLLYYIAVSSIIFVAAYFNNMVIPGVKGGATYYIIQWLP